MDCPTSRDGTRSGSKSGPLFSRSSRRAQEDCDEMTRSRAGLESRLGEVSAEAQGLRARLSDLEMQAAAGEAAHSAIQDRSRELEADNRRLAEERDRAEALGARAPRRAGASARPSAASRSRRSPAATPRSPRWPSVRRRSSGWRRIEKLARPRWSRCRPDRANWRRTIGGWPRSGTAPRPSPASSAPGWSEREAASQEQAQAIAGRDAEIAALADARPWSIGWKRSGRLVGPRWSRSRGRLERSRADNRRLGEETGAAPRPGAPLRPGWRSARPLDRWTDRNCSRHGIAERRDRNSTDGGRLERARRSPGRSRGLRRSSPGGESRGRTARPR